MLAAAATIYVLRSPATYTAATLWAEDGTLFFKDAIEHGWGTLLTPYAGQIVIVSRTVAGALAPLPAAIQPSLYAIAAAVIAVLSCSVTLSSRWREPIPLSLRFAGVLTLLAVPGVGEAYGRLANAHWWLGVGLLLLGMLRDPLSRITKLGELGFAVMATTSGFVAVYALPALGIRAIRNRSIHSLAVLAIAVTGVALQTVVLMLSARRGDLGALLAEPTTAVQILVKRIPATLSVGDSNLAVLWPLGSPSAIPLLLAGALTSGLVVLWLHSPKLETGGLVLTVLGGWILAFWALTQPGLSPEMLLWPSAAARFFLIPKAAILLSLIVAWPYRNRWIAIGIFVCSLLSVGVISDYRAPTPSPPVDWPSFARCVDLSRAMCSVVIPPNWTLEVEGRGD